MNVLVIGNGGREHALCLGIKNSSKCENLFCMPGSDSIKKLLHVWTMMLLIIKV